MSHSEPDRFGTGLSDEQRNKLNRDLDPSRIDRRKHDGASYISGANVIRALNDVFGADGWNYEIKDIQCVYDGSYKGKDGSSGYVVAYTSIVRLHIKAVGCQEEGGAFSFVSYKSPAESHVTAYKAAITIGLKRAAKKLGNPLGLALYVDDPEEGVSEAGYYDVLDQWKFKVQEIYQDEYEKYEKRMIDKASKYYQRSIRQIEKVPKWFIQQSLDAMNGDEYQRQTFDHT